MWLIRHNWILRKIQKHDNTDDKTLRPSQKPKHTNNISKVSLKGKLDFQLSFLIRQIPYLGMHYYNEYLTHFFLRLFSLT